MVCMWVFCVCTWLCESGCVGVLGCVNFVCFVCECVWCDNMIVVFVCVLFVWVRICVCVVCEKV